ncbi:hypothetical protein M405DRAFT_825059 [Rhizopogon salebrosus TDB-379]|nr:hypothetical protein M405DRAFT_825059 [Rhizopogon salebrosus TDB-379]
MSPRTTFLSVLPFLTLGELEARGTHLFLAEFQSYPSRSTPHAPAHEDCPGTQGWLPGRQYFSFLHWGFRTSDGSLRGAR